MTDRIIQSLDSGLTKQVNARRNSAMAMCSAHAFQPRVQGIWALNALTVYSCRPDNQYLLREPGECPSLSPVEEYALALTPYGCLFFGRQASWTRSPTG
jgi:hypothetical protein